MGQLWDIINVDRREQGFVDSGKLGSLFFSDLRYLYRSLHIPCLPEKVDKWLSYGTFAIQPEPIGELPTEVLDMIYETILNDTNEDHPELIFLTCVSLAITCNRLLSVGKCHIQRALIPRHARAADCRIVCLGEYADKDDQAPPGMLTDAEIKELETTKMPYEDEEPTDSDESTDDDEPTDDDLEERCLYIFAAELYKYYGDALHERSKPMYTFMDRFHTQLLEAQSESHNEARDAALTRDLKMFKTIAGVSYYGCQVTYPGGLNVLCNMSKGECVREDALVKLESKWCRVTLAHAVFSRICYSLSHDISIACSKEVEEKLVKGPWAGDRFRITSADDMPTLPGGKEWKDVTKEVSQMLRHLWRHGMREDAGEDEELND
ncbi:hypothetical protein GSI_03216 [Ganoderma sinense ZZ0214-1]|uniref:Uncharacterized protein n=1 Tax=Ganoderma sinense ZZ0214-1 TaxID=1077348 RepID=A0A2G8SL07_9APHY|nr:hypothetical protein GSI_03216 [Ganoderma sinense ZZ0214-1]